MNDSVAYTPQQVVSQPTAVGKAYTNIKNFQARAYIRIIVKYCEKKGKSSHFIWKILINPK